MENSSFLIGFVLQSSMILALGAQNLFVIEKGLLKDRAVLVATICSVCDITLIFLGVLGAGSFFTQNEALTILLKLVGSAFLIKYAVEKYAEAGKVRQVKESFSLKSSSVKSIVMSTLAVSLLNPHVYLDTVVLLGGYSTKFPGTFEKVSFAAGAGLLSTIWFFSVIFAARFFSQALKNSKVMEKVNYATAAIMGYLGITLLLSA